jgi:alginate O-acetyltransferase complex protein AlgI
VALNSWQFLLFASAAVLIVPIFTGGARAVVFLAFNAVFIWSYWGPESLPYAVGYGLTGYLAARLVQGRGTVVLVASVALLSIAFVYMRGYQLGGQADAGGPGTANALAFVGLSFLFFKMIHVVVDSWSGTIGHLSIRHYANYCLSFTTVLMGPIERYQDFVAQSDGQAPRTFEVNLDGVNRVLRGLLKAFVLAPFVAPYALKHGLPIETLEGGDLLLRTYAFYAFLYLDFSGYCDIVIGIASLMGHRLPENFNFPFLSRNVSEYWLRVHRSLTLWLTDYIFTPTYRWALGSGGLGAHGFLALAGSLMLTMIVAGVWHGTTLNFAAFGLVHGAALVAVRGYEHIMVAQLGRARLRRFEERPGVKIAAIFLTYNFTSLAYVFFALDLDEGIRVLERLATTVGGLRS